MSCEIEKFVRMGLDLEQAYYGAVALRTLARLLPSARRQAMREAFMRMR